MKHIHGGNIYQFEGCLDYSANLNPLGLPERVKEAVVDSLKDASLYPEVGYAPLRSAIAEYEGVQPEEVICGNGAAELIYTLCRAVKPKKALVPAPTFAEYEQALGSVNAEIQFVQLEEEAQFQLNERFLDAITEEIDILFLCNPNNPTGLLIPREYLLRVLARCEEMHVQMVVDECFLDFVKNPEEYTLVQYLEQHPNLFLLKAFTKRYAMAGIRLGYGLCHNPKLLEEMNRMVQPWNLSVMAEAAGIAALKETEYVESGRKIVFEELDYLKAEFQRMGLKIYDSQANYLFFQAQEDFFEKAVEKGILIRDCRNYTGLRNGYFRIAVGLHEQNEILVRRFQEILNQR